MPTKAIDKPEAKAEVKAPRDPNLAGPEFKECAGQPLVDVQLQMLEPDETNVKPNQTFHYTFNDTDYFIERGRHKKIPRDHYLMLRVGMPRL
jgi:hypothetical protein